MIDWRDKKANEAIERILAFMDDVESHGARVTAFKLPRRQFIETFGLFINEDKGARFYFCDRPVNLID